VPWCRSLALATVLSDVMSVLVGPLDGPVQRLMITVARVLVGSQAMQAPTLYVI
jgi:hypothetical protein